MADNDMNEVFSETMVDSTVITVPIDDTLSNSGEAADAKAVGDALALKADVSSVVSITVNGEGADNQGHILIDGTDIPMSSTDNTTLKAKIEAVDGKTGADLSVSSSDSRTVAEAIAEAAASSGDIYATNVMMAEGSETSISAKIANMDTVANQHSTDISALKAKTANEFVMSSTDSTTIKQAIEARVASVNGQEPDETGNVQVVHALTADNLSSSHSQAKVGTFSRRTSGGGAPISSGKAFLNRLLGTRTHVGYSAPTLTHSASLAPREEGDEYLQYTINEATFVTAVSGATTTKTFTYTTEWSETLETYGITATNAISGDQITVVYTAEVRGTIYQSNPEFFVSTGWNLFNSEAGFAYGLKYDELARFRIKGNYTAVKFSATQTGDKTTISPVDGLFTIPSNGFIWVEGGDATTTEVYMTWADWVEAADGPSTFQAYTESVIDMSMLFDSVTYPSCPFPYGLLQTGNVRDEVNFNTGAVISRVERLAYSVENLETAETSGRTYEYDTNYIYLERAAEIEYDLDDYGIDGEYAVDDHGLEMYPFTVQAIYSEMTYGNSLRNKLEVDVLTISQQTLNATQTAQVQNNIGVAPMIGIVEPGLWATNNISKGQYVVWKGALYTADAAITANTLLASSGTGKNLTACSSGGLNALNSNVGYVEDNNAIAVYDSRITITKKIYRKYTNGKREVYLAGTLAKQMASSAATIASLTDTQLSEGAFVAKVGGDAYLGFLTNNSGTYYINVVHSNTFSSGIAVALYIVFFV